MSDDVARREELDLAGQPSGDQIAGARVVDRGRGASRGGEKGGARRGDAVAEHRHRESDSVRTRRPGPDGDRDWLRQIEADHAGPGRIGAGHADGSAGEVATAGGSAKANEGEDDGDD
jgi:hypothetical protein